MKRLSVPLFALALLCAAAPADTLYWGGGTTNIPNGTTYTTWSNRAVAAETGTQPRPCFRDTPPYAVHNLRISR